MYDLAIIGSGPAGMTAAIYGVRSSLSLVLLESVAPGGQIVNTNEIQNYPGMGSINGAELAIKMYEHTQELGVPFNYLTAESVKHTGPAFEVECLEDRSHPLLARSVIVATGTRPRMLGVKGEDRFKGNGLSWCAVCDGAACRGQDVVVIGGGNSAIEEALFLSEVARSVTVVVRKTVRADRASLGRLKSNKNVSILLGWEVCAFEGSSSLEGVSIRESSTREERVVSCQHAFEYVGLEPLTKCVEPLGVIDDAGYILADQAMRTVVPGLFAAGDCVKKDLRQVVTACSDGALAARSAAQWLASRERENN